MTWLKLLIVNSLTFSYARVKPLSYIPELETSYLGMAINNTVRIQTKLS